MTETEWLACQDPQDMVKHLRGYASDRKLRLFTSACCQRSSFILNHKQLGAAVEALERYADRKATYHDMVCAAKDADRAGWSLELRDRFLAEAVWVATAMNLWYWLRPVPRTLRVIRHLQAYDPGQAITQCATLRDIFGNPFRSVALDTRWLAREVVSLTQSTYDDCRFGDMSILADALEEAGCTELAILEHCRSDDEHVRGCWVVDLLLGKM